jgi:hypothetical protein
MKVRKIAEKENRVRYTGSKLKKTDDTLTDYSKEKAEADFDGFSVKKVNIRKANEMKEFARKCGEGRVKYT